MVHPNAQPDSDNTGQTDKVAVLNQKASDQSPQQIIAMAYEMLGHKMATVSSFGADSAVLLHMLSQIDTSLPVIFLDTGKHFDETLQYRNQLIAALGLSDVRFVHPDPARLKLNDPDGVLHKTDTDKCCQIRKVEPMARSLKPFDGWLTGRKRFQNHSRADLPFFETVGPRLRINPLLGVAADFAANYVNEHRLPPNPLVPFGYLSIGCLPCTERATGDDPRSGRWAGQVKTECGIHLTGLDESLTSSSL